MFCNSLFVVSCFVLVGGYVSDLLIYGWVLDVSDFYFWFRFRFDLECDCWFSGVYG